MVWFALSYSSLHKSFWLFEAANGYLVTCKSSWLQWSESLTLGLAKVAEAKPPHLATKHIILSAFLPQAQTVNFTTAEPEILFTHDFQLGPTEKVKENKISKLLDACLSVNMFCCTITIISKSSEFNSSSSTKLTKEIMAFLLKI